MEKCDPEFGKRQEKIRERLKKLKKTIEKCTPDYPYTQDRDSEDIRWIHTESREIPNSKRDGKVTMECKICGKQWEKKLPYEK